MSLIVATSQSSFTVFNVVVPLAAALIGGGFALLGTLIQGKITEKHAEQSRRRDLSIESARKVDIQLVELQHVIIAQTEFSARSFQSPNYGLTIRDRIAIICAEMDLHRRYIDDKRLRESIHEATLFLRPYGGFEEELNETTTGIARNIVHWLTPMIQAHIMDEELPPEPSYVEDYREAHNKTKALWDNFWHRFDQSQAPKDQRDSE